MKDYIPYLVIMAAAIGLQHLAIHQRPKRKGVSVLLSISAVVILAAAGYLVGHVKGHW